MRVEHHLLRLAKIGAHEWHAAIGQPHLRQLHGSAAVHAYRSPRGSSRTDRLPAPANAGTKHSRPLVQKAELFFLRHRQREGYSRPEPV